MKAIKQKISAIFFTLILCGIFSHEASADILFSAGNNGIATTTNASYSATGVKSVGENASLLINKNTTLVKDAPTSLASYNTLSGTAMASNGYVILGDSTPATDTKIATIATNVISANFRLHATSAPIRNTTGVFSIGLLSNINADIYRFDIGNGSASIYRYGASVASSAFAVSQGVIYSVDFYKQGNTLKGYVNGVLLVSYVDGTPYAGGAVKVALSSSNTGTWCVSDIVLDNNNVQGIISYPTATSFTIDMTNLSSGANQAFLYDGFQSTGAIANMSAYYDMSNRSGTTVASWDSTLSGSLNNVSFVYGYMGDGLMLPGNGYVSVGGFPYLSQMTVNAMVKFSDAQSNADAKHDPIIGKWDTTTTKGFLLYRRGLDGKLGFAISSNGSLETVAYGSTVLQPDQWYQVTGSYDGVNIRVYVNGMLEGTVAHAGGVNNTANSLMFGRYANSANTTTYANITLDEVRVFSSALALNDVKTLVQRKEPSTISSSSQSFIVLKGAVPTTPALSASYNIASNRSVLTWNDTSSLDASVVQMPTIIGDANIGEIDYAKDSGTFFVIPRSDKTKYYKLSHGLAAQSVTGIASSDAIAVTPSYLYTLSGTTVKRLNSAGVVQATVAIAAGYTRLHASDNPVSGITDAIIAVNPTTKTALILNSSTLATIQTLNLTSYVSGAIVDAMIDNGVLYAISSAKLLDVTDIVSGVKTSYTIAAIQGTPEHILMDDNSLYISTNTYLNAVSKPNSYEILRSIDGGASSLVTKTISTQFTDTQGDNVAPSAPTSSAVNLTNGILTSLVLNSPADSGHVYSYTVRTKNGFGVGVDVAGVSTASAGFQGFDVIWDANPNYDNALPTVQTTLTSITPPVIGDGAYYAHIKSADAAGNWSAVANFGPYTINAIPPQVYGVTLSKKKIVAGDTVVFTVKTSKQLDTTASNITINGTTVVGAWNAVNNGDGTWSYSKSYTFTAVSSKLIIVSINAKDLGGLETAKLFNFNIGSGWVQVIGSVGSNTGVLLPDDPNQRENGVLGEVVAPEVVGVSPKSNTIINKGNNYEALPIKVVSGSNRIDIFSLYGKTPTETVAGNSNLDGDITFKNGYVYEYNGNLTIGQTSPISFKGKGVVIVNGTITIKKNIQRNNKNDTEYYNSTMELLTTGDIVIDPAVTKVDATLKANGTVYTGTLTN